MLDVARDHLLYLLSQAVEFGDNRLMFKGGTSWRKCRLGNPRFRKPTLPAGSVVRPFITTMTCSDFRSALRHFPLWQG
ncbi:hypothetical protein MLAC_06060 [Mycobacterium lacus]|uniref:Uncharacterized protein n=1 Tax=Mycobacterium lacus TaxID=169765 RepID=A0A7I7NF65_9MYCO|nr:hypothetical protein MLAC_06060 [Mycobacterium lacus]